MINAHSIQRVRLICTVSAISAIIEIAAAVFHVFQEQEQAKLAAWLAQIVLVSPALAFTTLLCISIWKLHPQKPQWHHTATVAAIFLCVLQGFIGVAGLYVVPAESWRTIRLDDLAILLSGGVAAWISIYLFLMKRYTSVANDLESSLKQAWGATPDAQNTIWRQLYRGNIFVALATTTIARTENGMKQLQLRCWEKDGHTFIPAYCTLQSLQEHLPDSAYAEMSARDLLQYLPPGMAIMLEPMREYGFVLTPDRIAELFQPTQGPFKTGTMVQQIDSLLFGTPAFDVSNIVTELSTAFRHTKQIEKAYLVLCVDKNESPPGDIHIYLDAGDDPLKDIQHLLIPRKVFIDKAGRNFGIIKMKPGSTMAKLMAEKFTPFFEARH